MLSVSRGWVAADISFPSIGGMYSRIFSLTFVLSRTAKAQISCLEPVANGSVMSLKPTEENGCALGTADRFSGLETNSGIMRENTVQI